MNNGLEFPIVISLAVNTDGDVFAGTFEGGGVYRSTDDGENWTSGDIFAGTYFGNGVFRSSDAGSSWNEKNDGMIATEVRTIVTQGPIPRLHSPTVDAADFIFAGTLWARYISIDRQRAELAAD